MSDARKTANICCPGNTHISCIIFKLLHVGMDPNPTAPREQTDLGQYCLKYGLPKKIGKQESRRPGNAVRFPGIATATNNADCFFPFLEQISPMCESNP